MQVEYAPGKFVDIPQEAYFSENFSIKDWIPENPDELSEIEVSKNRELRKKEYMEVSDPLFMEWQYDRTRAKEMAWRAAVANIKTKYPLK